MSVSQDNHLLYFAYGVDMNPEHIAARCDEPQVFMVAHLPDHALAFFSDIPTAGTVVWKASWSPPAIGYTG
ncbi:gamma-glutamylcyclotransferase family protein [Azotobacter vinelandii]